jgi:hypothetical protein
MASTDDEHDDEDEACGNGEEDGARGGVEGGGCWKIRAHRPRSRGGTNPAADRITEVPDGRGGLQNTPGRSFVRSLDSPAN